MAELKRSQFKSSKMKSMGLKKNLIEEQDVRVSLKPKALVNHFFNKISVGTAFLVVLIATLFELVLLACLKFPGAFGTYGLLRIAEAIVISWFLMGVIFYVVALIIKGNNHKENLFNKILSGLSSFKAVYILFLLLATIIILIFANPLISLLQTVFLNPSVLVNGTLVFPVFTGFHIFGMILLCLLFILFIVYVFIMLYHLVGEIYNIENGWGKFFLTLLMIGVFVLISWLVTLI
ncbi:MAG TPA: hypothetical protein PKK56_01885 [archaeon]|jgi:hypothetical protein|nr:hypothetical protein [archaeon]HPC10197.1 hypothetical protein [archaeon]HRT02764.1 hypothetical protein [Candidatus Diapherotrites archaeon]